MARVACLGAHCQYQLHIPVSAMRNKQAGLTIIELMLSLPIKSLDSMAIQREITDIGKS